MEIEVTDDIRVAPESKNMIRILSEAFEKRTPIDINGKQYMVVAKSNSVFSMRRVESAKAAEWNGEGLPPVGTACEVLWNESRMEFLRTRVFGVNEHGQPIHRFDEGPKKYAYQADALLTTLGNKVFRPIRTPEQIAAEERDIEIQALADELAGYDDELSARDRHREMATYLIDQGYGKKVTL